MTPPLIFGGLIPDAEALVASGADPVFGPGGSRRADVVASAVDEAVSAAIRAGGDGSGHYPRPPYPETAAGELEARLRAQEDGLRGMCLSLHRRVSARGSGNGHRGWRCDESVLSRVARPGRSWSAFDLSWALAQFPSQGGWGPGFGYVAALHLPLLMAASLPSEALAPFAPALKAVDSFLREHGPFRMGVAELRTMRREVATLLGRLADESAHRWPFGINHDEDEFAPAARALLADRDPAVSALLDHCDELGEGRKPSAAWQRRGTDLLAAVPGSTEIVRELLVLFTGQREREITLAEGWTERRLLFDWSTTTLRGLVWLAASDPDEATTTLLAEVAKAAGRPYAKGGPGVPRVAKLATAAVAVLEARDAQGPALVRLRDAVRNKPLRARIDALVATAAQRAGLTFDSYLELAVPDHGLDTDRRLSVDLGEYAATITIDAVRDVRLEFSRAGKPLKTAPAAVRREHTDAVAALRAEVKAMRATLAAERRRVDDLFSAERTWTFDTWRSQLLAHPVTGVFAEGLLWRIGEHTVRPRASGTGAWQLEDLTHRVVTPHAGTPVRLWHPGSAPTEEVTAWRDRLIAEGVSQPLKQIFREVYPLTPAEEATRSYSNRFAGHILNYRQAAALLSGRGWDVKALGYWDDGYEGTAVKKLGAGTWQASFRYALVEQHDDVAQFCSTDQVRFGRRDGTAWRAADLAEVPRLVLSEALRDVDLAVGVASIATDPAWYDRGDGPLVTYWHTAVDAELSPSAEVRRDALTRLLPRTRLAGRAELTGRYLRVHGNLSSYRIHLGSGNVLVEPENSYLCIVPGAGQGPQVLLPFDDDRLLSLILSKAFLLLDDQGIDDPTILSQLPRRADTSV
ncbi:DUF4132 domain-containing protein [Cryptosporangium phraense]|uniref:DUF4132 domain-containing protein n=1 Tax=Cryptosporangium phraense TaxID=2593070 RepID=A0A545AZU3_9ACTN|nr:DUF4132 domain-containing protein [Cryptosporangium phraense]TQS46853.1 DUF4132 domain-containing protein [Cryptosporangium phraense]